MHQVSRRRPNSSGNFAILTAMRHGVRGGVLHQNHHWFGHHRLDHRHVVFQQK